MTLGKRIKNAWAMLRGKKLSTTANIWHGADASRLFGDWVAGIMPADDEMRWSADRMRARARELSRNNPYVRQYLNLLAVNVIGPSGIGLQAQTRNANGELARAINDKIEAAWADWGQQPTIDGRLSFTRMQQLLIKSVARDGEVFVRLMRGYQRNAYGFALELIDPDLVDAEMNEVAARGRNQVRMGVELDEADRPVAYHVWNAPASHLAFTQRERVRIPADQVLHLYDPERVAQSRGITWLAPVMVALRELDTYQETAVVAARVGAAQMAFLTRKTDADGEGPIADEEGKLAMDVEPGQIPFAPDGYEVQSWNPTHPHASHAEFCKQEARRIAAGLGVSYNALFNDLEGVNYSSIRAGLLIERDKWRSDQNWWIEAFLRPVFREWLSSALLSGALVLDTRDFRRFLNVRWNPRGWAWVDPLKDTQAGIEGIQNGLASRTKLLAEQGIDIEEVFEDLERENKLAASYGIEIAPAEPAGNTNQVEDTKEDTEEAAAVVLRRAGILNGGRA